jgi:uncharacterized pyridoxamine 5'-phosphate oxidase family protein
VFVIRDLCEFIREVVSNVVCTGKYNTDGKTRKKETTLKSKDKIKICVQQTGQ